ncbi:MAG: Deoxyribodipyrimidine photo-lyase [Candidatus Omnitrophica bacterium]|nr:Deoxyribodipyrimidine photo-lyase [Candidatus Omnitrophota bacterium]
MPETSSTAPTIVWYRQDLRIGDHPALSDASARGPVVPVYILWDEEEGGWAPGSASRWWLHHSLKSLSADLADKGSPLVIRRGPALKTLLDLARQTGASGVVWNRRYEPAAIARDTAVKAALRREGLTAESHNGSLLFEPWEIKTGSGGPFKVFTPFWRACRAATEPPAPLKAPRTLTPPRQRPSSLRIEDLGLLPRIGWDKEFYEHWKPGEAGAARELSTFLKNVVDGYAVQRDVPAVRGTSRLSPHLHWGDIGPRQVWHAVLAASVNGGRAGAMGKGAETYLKELCWREFAYHVLYHQPRTVDVSLREEFEHVAWSKDRSALKRWQSGRTGYPIVDAGLRELWVTGWMHNRVRMIVGSFLTKDLLIPWRKGAEWFWDTLVDADLASNTFGWQWVAGCGADAAPYFRIFNPVLQSERFDPQGEYLRRWLPELARLGTPWIHRPWEAPPEVLRAAGVRLGEEYPLPMVDHAEARERTLEAFKVLKSAGR